MKIKSFTKIISGILCAALTMQIGWGLNVEQINADAGFDFNNNTATFSYVGSSGTDVYYIRRINGNLCVTKGYGSNASIGSISSNCNLVINHDCTVYVDALFTFHNIELNGGADADSNAELRMTSANEPITIDGTIKGSGQNRINLTTELQIDTLDCNQMYNDGITIFNMGSGGEIVASNVIINKEIWENDDDFSGGAICVTDSFEKDDLDGMKASVFAETNTSIKSTGGTFTLRVDNKELIKSISTPVDGEAYDLFDDPSVSLGEENLPLLYYGQSYDFSELISVAKDYDETLVYLEYKHSDNSITSDQPISVGSYSVCAIAPKPDSYGSFKDGSSGWKNYSIAYLPESELGVSAPYFTINGIVNDKYVPDDLLLTTVNGLQAGSTYAPDSNFTNSLTIDSSLMFRDGSLNDDYCIALRRTSDNATTAEHTLTYYYPNASELIYDPYDPYVDVQFVDGREMSIEDGMLTGDNVVIGIGDENLDKIYINGELYDYEEIEEGYVELELNSTVGKATEYSIKATDLAGRSTTMEFTLFPNTADADISVSVPGTIYAGDNYSVDVKTNSDGEVSLQYKDASTNTVLSSKPTSAGKYTVTAIAEETDFYFEVSNSTSYTIIKRTPDTTLSVPSVVYVGDDYDVESTTDSDGNVIYQYYDKNNDSYLSSKPSSVGEYTVTARTTETSKYYSSEDSASFKIIKRDPTISLSVPDTTIGQTYSPELVTNSNSNSITYEYKVKDAADSTYSKTKPTAAGSYTIRVTIGSTDKFNGASATDDFTISKKTPSVTLGVGTPYAGTTYSPTFYSNSDAADRAVFEYKEKNADDSKYSTTLPTAYGEYVVRVTIPETAEFAKTIVTADYRVIYLAAPQTAYVIEGQTGKNNYFISDVVLKAPTGYTISAVYGGPYTASIPYKDGITSVYLKRTSDNALTTAIPITNAPRVDKNAPSISAKTGTITPGAVMYASDFILNVSDPNLRSLKINGEAVDLKNYKDGYTLALNPGYGSQTYKIMAEDEAGNVTTLEFTLKAEWLKDKVIIPDVVLPLEGNESYNLGDGYWLVTRNTPEGPVTDKTVYSGNMPFYVPEGGDYTFTKVT